MALMDLKRKYTQSDKQPLTVFSVDDFIDDALNYAKGDPKVVSIHRVVTQSVSALDPKVLASLECKPFRRATFTLSESVIMELTQLSECTGKAKSKIVRELIEQFYECKIPKPN